MTDQPSHPRDTQDELSPTEPPVDDDPEDDSRPATEASTSHHAAALWHPLCAAAVLAALALMSTTGHAAPPQLFGPQEPGRLKVRGGIPVVFSPRPAADGSGRQLAALDAAAVVVTFRAAPSAQDLDDLRSAGAELPLDRQGQPLGSGRFVAARMSPAALRAAARLATVERIHLDGSPFGHPRPLDGTTAEVQAQSVWQSGDALDLPIAGQGMTVCDLDGGVDIFHPMFFRADGGYLPWIDVDESGSFTPGVDAVSPLGDGTLVTLRVLDGVISEFFNDQPLFGSDDPGYAVGMDWLYADLNGNGVRDFGRQAGFDDATPSLGEPLYVADDVNDNGLVDLGEKLVALGSSKIKAVRWDLDVYRRGENLVDVPRDQQIDHGCGSAGVMVGGQRGLSTKVGVAPEADLIMASQRESQDQESVRSYFCASEGARVILHEYAPWTGYHLDGSSPLEQSINQMTFQGVAHINPAGNLGTAHKLYKHDHPAGVETVIDVDVPAVYPGDFRFMAVTVLWREPGRQLSITLEDPTGFTRQMPSSEGYLYEDWHDDLSIWAERADSSRGTAMLDIWLFGSTNPPPPIPAGTWKVRMTDLEPTGAPDLEVFGYVMDELSGWGEGIYFPTHASFDHLVGWPGTADHAITVAAYTGHGYGIDTPGHYADYSGRGWRIDGEDIMDIAGPDDPITAGYRSGQEARYFVYGGTSGASPHVAGAAALILQATPEADGADVRQAIQQGALADEQVGSAPNHEWGYGKLRIYRSIYDSDPPSGAAPTLQPLVATVIVGQLETLTVAVDDPDEPVEALLLELDRDYDGHYDEQLDGGSFDVLFDAPTTMVAKLRATDSTGREAVALATITAVEEEEPPVLPPEEVASTLVPAGGCACTTRPSRPARTAWLAMLAPLLVLGRRWSRRRPSAAH